VSETAPATPHVLVDPPRQSLDRSPVLLAVLERVAGEVGSGLAGLTSALPRARLEAVRSVTAGEALAAFAGGIAAIHYSPEWDARILIGCDRRLVLTIAEAMFGGDGSEPEPDGSRPLGAVAVRAAREVIALAARALQAELAPIERVSLVLERCEVPLDPAAHGPSDLRAIVATLSVELCRRSARLFVLLPQLALGPIRKRLEREKPAATPHHDPVWAHRLVSEVGRADVRIGVAIEGPEMTLGSLARLAVGQIVPLSATTEGLVTMESEGRPLFRCRLGQSRGHFSVQIDHRIDDGGETLGDLLAG
jgi:flagellar motor switch protein FliM